MITYQTLLVTCLGICSVAPAETRYAQTEDGVKVAFETLGEGVPIFLIAGGPGDSSYTFKYAHTLLRSCGMLVFVENRGRGKSEDCGDRQQPYTLANDIKDVEAIRKALGLDKIIVFGHSYGGMVAMAYAARNPERTLALITSSTLHGARAWQEKNIDWAKSFLRTQYPEKWKRIEELHAAGHKTGEGELATLFNETNFLLTWHPYSRWELRMEFDRQPEERSLQYNREVYLAMVGDDPEWTMGGTLKDVELLPELSNYKGPALIMGGRYDWICPPVVQHEIADALPNAKLVLFEYSGHLLHEDEPLRFVNVVTEFILGLSTRR